MNFKHGRLACSLLLAGFLSACGGGNGEESTAVQSTYSGTVRDSKGAPIAGLSVALENRITDEKFTTTTDGNGSFSILVNQGTYDILFDDEKSTKYTTLQKTAINLRTDQDDSIQLHSAEKHSNTLFTGTVTDTSNQILAGRKLLILPSIARSTAAVGIAQVPDPIMVTTDENGNFETQLGKDGMEFDFDVLLIPTNTPGLDVEKMSSKPALLDSFNEKFEESLDIEKPNGAMHLNMRIGAEDRNLRNATGGPSPVAEDALQFYWIEKKPKYSPIMYEAAWSTIKNTIANTILSVIPSAYAGDMRKKFLWIPAQSDTNQQIIGGTLIDGGILPISSCKYISLSAMNNGVQDLDMHHLIFAGTTQFCLKYNSNRLTPVYPPIHNQRLPSHMTDNIPSPTYTIELITRWPSHYRFTDMNGSTYALKAMDTKALHLLNYDSDSPAIVKVEYSMDEN